MMIASACWRDAMTSAQAIQVRGFKYFIPTAVAAKIMAQSIAVWRIVLTGLSTESARTWGRIVSNCSPLPCTTMITSPLLSSGTFHLGLCDLFEKTMRNLELIGVLFRPYRS